MGLVTGTISCGDCPNELQFHVGSVGGPIVYRVPVNSRCQFAANLPAGTYWITKRCGHPVSAPQPFYCTCLPQNISVLGCPAPAAPPPPPPDEEVQFVLPADFPNTLDRAQDLYRQDVDVKIEGQPQDYKIQVCWTEERIDGEVTQTVLGAAVMGKIVGPPDE